MSPRTAEETGSRLLARSRSTAVVRGIVLLAVFATSFSAILIRLSSAAPVVIAAWRMSFAALMTIPFALAARRRDTAPAGRGETWLTIGAGVFLALHFAAWNSSLNLTSVVHATILVTLHPLLILVVELLSPSQRVSAGKVIAVVVAFAGAVVLSTGGSISGRAPTPAGDALAILGALAVAGYMLLGSRARKSIGTARYTLRVYAVAAVILMVWGLAANRTILFLPPRDFLIFAALAFLCTLLGHSVFNWAFRYLPTSDVSVSILLEPLFASIMAVFFFRELPGPWTIVGAVIVVAALAVISLLDRPS